MLNKWKHKEGFCWSIGRTVQFQTMLDIFRGLKNLVKISHVNTDSPVFRLHYSITVMILMAFSLIVTTKQYVGNPIDCVHTKDIPEEVLNTYCWIHSTYALKSLFLKKVGSEVPYPGVGNSDGKNIDKKIYKYYQWVCFCLFFQVSVTSIFTYYNSTRIIRECKSTSIWASEIPSTWDDCGYYCC